MSSFSAPLAEAYVMKKKYEEKLKRMQKVEAGREDQKGHEKSSCAAQKTKNSSRGFVSRMFKKVHPSSAVLPSSEYAVQS